jgi:hypothetical protein
MIKPNDHPVAWGPLLYELEDAREHLAQRVQAMAESPGFDEHALRIGLGHVFARLNRAWNARNGESAPSEAQCNAFQAFP